MDLETALTISEDCADGNGYLIPMDSLLDARQKIVRQPVPFSTALAAIEWELHIRSVSPAQIDA